MKIASAKQMHDTDKSAIETFGMTEAALMESAGHRVAEAVKKMFGEEISQKSICVLSGSGNNGGDALVAARYLSNVGARVKIFLTGNKSHRTESLEMQMKILRSMGVEFQQLENDRAWERLQVTLRFTDAIIDGILGTGFSGQIRPSALRLIRLANSSNKPIISVDIPSGVETDTGAVEETAIKATCTVTFGLPKIGHFICPGAAYVGEIFVDDIGLPAKLLTDDIHQTLIDDELAATLLPEREKAAYKGSCGKILVVAGSKGMTGAASLAAKSALRAGAGLVTLACPESLNEIYETKLTEVMTAPLPEFKSGIIGGDKAFDKILDLADNADAILIGPGLGREKETQELVKKLVETADKPLVMDADALFPFNGNIDGLKLCKQIPIITPHFGELAALLEIAVEDLRKGLIEIVRKTAQDYRTIIVAKAESTVVAYPNGEIFISPLGNSSMATAGSGDVLAGTIAGLMKQTPFAPLAGVYLHGTAGDIADLTKCEGLIASDIMENLPAAISKLRKLRRK